MKTRRLHVNIKAEFHYLYPPKDRVEENQRRLNDIRIAVAVQSLEEEIKELIKNKALPGIL